MNTKALSCQSANQIGRVRHSILVLAGVCLVFGLGIPQKSFAAKSETVNCARSSIQSTLDKAPPFDSSRVIRIQGTCVENVLVTDDHIALVGDGGGAVDGTITVSGARSVSISGLKVSGSGDGIIGTANASLTISDSEITGNAGHGVVLTDGAYGRIHNSIVSNNANAGVRANDRGQVDVSGSTISGNLSTDFGGVDLGNGSFGRIADSTIENNAGEGVSVYNHSSVGLSGNTISGNGTIDFVDPVNPAEYFRFDHSGIGVYNGSHARISGGNVVSGSSYFAVAAWGGSVVRQGTFQPRRFVDSGAHVGPAGETDTFVQRASTGGTLPDGSFDQPGLNFGAVEVGRMSTMDLRNVNIDGHLSRFHSAYMDVRFGTITNGSVFCNVFGSQFGPMIRSSVDYNGRTFDPFLDCF